MDIRDERKCIKWGIGQVEFELSNAERDPKHLDRKQSHAWFNDDEDGRTKFAPAPDA